jgi:hypothetical protein
MMTPEQAYTAWGNAVVRALITIASANVSLFYVLSRGR